MLKQDPAAPLVKTTREPINQLDAAVCRMAPIPFGRRTRLGSVVPAAGVEMPEHVRVEITPDQGVTAIIYLAVMRDQAGVALILAHGAGGKGCVCTA